MIREARLGAADDPNLPPKLVEAGSRSATSQIRHTLMSEPAAPQPPGRTTEDQKEFRDATPESGRLIGIDAGTKTLGLALSDVRRMIASPLETIRRTKFKADAERLLSLVAEHNVIGLVLGLPLNLDGSEGPRAQATRALARNLNKLSPLPILLWDERLTTAEAQRMLIDADQTRKRRAEVIDKLAATIILQSALDRFNHKA
jgi:putative Holliday junction resolvase